MVTAIALAALVVALLATVLVWRMQRRVVAAGDMTVSRQWLLEHESDDRA